MIYSLPSFIAELFLKPLLVLGLLPGFESEVESDDLYFSIGVDLTVLYFEKGLCSRPDDDASQSLLCGQVLASDLYALHFCSIVTFA